MKRSGIRCPNCGYSLRGLRTLTCPECGEEVTLARVERMEASRLDRRERVWMGVWGAATFAAAGLCVGLAVLAGVHSSRSWEIAGLLGAGGVLLLARSAAYWGACIRGRRGGWVDELFEMLRGGS
jgi:ribosomal protein S27AE